MKNLFLYAVNLAVIAALLCIGCDSGVNGNSEKVDLFLSRVGNVYLVKFDANGGSGTVSSEIVKVGGRVSLPSGSGLSRSGCTFGGWNTNSSGTGTTYPAYTYYTAQENVTLYAKWNYTVTFSANGGNGTVSSQSASSGSQITLPSGSGLSMAGYGFGGWNTQSSGDGTNYSAGSSYTVTDGVTLYAKWNPIYTVTFDVNGGDGTPPNVQSAQSGRNVTLPNGNGLSRTGYIFGGWNTQSSGDGTNYSAGFSYTVTESVTLYAKWSLPYTVTFDATGGIVTPASGTTGEGWKLASLPTPTKSGYFFDGWYTETTGGTLVTTNTVFSENATIYAQWGGATFIDDRDDKSYKRVRIGDQVWMAENLNYDASGSKCYDNSNANCEKYGRLYNWATAMNGASSSSLSPSGVQGACPVGWHIPSDAEWTTLTDFVGGTSTAGTKLKATSGWYNNGNGMDNYGWSALPGGYGNSDGYFNDAGGLGSWWSATEDGANLARDRDMSYNNENVYRGSNGKALLFSVRCAQD
jgi:uncharacterized protein (TIGR02145 family)/uncharacterized repeat protein (TIGR02543 family)